MPLDGSVCLVGSHSLEFQTLWVAEEDAMLDFTGIPAMLAQLQNAYPSRTYMSGQGRYILNPPVADAEVARFEREHGIALPEDYRRFLVEYGDGGAWRTALFPLGCHMNWRQIVPWQGEEIGLLSIPFPHTQPWTQKYEGVKTSATDGDSEDDPDYEEWQKEYFNPRQMDGAIPLASLGCALSDWLVVTGPERGHVWGDYRAGGTGIVPLSTTERPRVTFNDWYLAWLDEELATLEGRPPTWDRPRYIAPAKPRSRQLLLFDESES
jgi:hypothetical protein